MTRAGMLTLGLLLASLALSVFGLEFALRSLGRVPYAGQEPRFAAHSHLVYLGNPRHPKMNSAGFCDIERTVSGSPGTLRVAAVGGSTTCGVSNWPSHLEAALAAPAVPGRADRAVWVIEACQSLAGQA